MKKTLSSFQYENIQLDLLTKADLTATLNWRNANAKWFNDANEIVFANHLKWFKAYEQKEDDLVFLVRNQYNDRVGQAAIYHIDVEQKKAEFGRFLVNPEFAGQKYMKITCLALMQIARSYLDLNSVYLEVKPENERALHIYKMAGFFEVGVLANGNLFMEKYLT